MGVLPLGILLASLSTAAADSSFQRWGGVPAVAYSGETGWQIGGLVMLFLRPTGPDDPGSETDLAAIWTTKEQYRIVLAPEFMFRSGTIRWKSSYEFRHWPGEYWAGGNEPTDSSLRYDMDQWKTEGNVRWSLGRGFRLAVEYDLERNGTSFHAPDSSVAASLPGAFPERPPTHFGGDRVGLGWSAEWDRRDHDNWPRSGTYAKFKQVVRSTALGSDLDFATNSLDLRGYVPTPLGGVGAFNAWWEGVMGDVPFDLMAMPDGNRHLRGLVKGRLAGRQEIVLQGEWRVPLFWRFGATTFAEAGKVGADPGDLARNDFHYSFGVGGRLALNPSRKVNMRGDLCWVDGGIGMTIYYKEAF